jgi:hypothetical protein
MALAFLGKAAASFRPSFGGRSNSDGDVIVEPRIRLRVRPKITYAFAGDGIAISDQPGDLAKLGKESIAEIGLCIDVLNDGDAPITIAEVGLAGWFESPQIAEHEPLLHDNKPWPRTLKPGENVIAHLASGLKHQSVLKSFRRGYVRTTDDLTYYGAGGPALKFYIKRMRDQASSSTQTGV